MMAGLPPKRLGKYPSEQPSRRVFCLDFREKLEEVVATKTKAKRSDPTRVMKGGEIVKKFLRGQRGFTLMEILIAVGILAILAGVAVPTVAHLRSNAEANAAKGELSNVQAAMDSMMSDQGLESVTQVTSENATATMTAFPSASHPLNGDATYGDYIRTSTTRYKYYCDTDGTVHQGAKA